ncbi:TIGR03084 family protein [Nocardia sp. ET3-3]|uniref:TIGR03084 family protein n=1 Tax=Nocardia terrae TaxID=2675851 RepID=A0A7K1V361_9NOCA|nr:TIGR03084 family metal-binding protein [Nocardia terrae]MVU80568.1 TIGR03084 family protein [Nocardia terrae]
MRDYGLDISGMRRDLALPDLVAEGEALDALVSAEPDWSKPTPAEGWTIAHQIAHLAAADANVLLAIRTPEAFDTVLKRADAEGAERADIEAAAGAAQPRAALLNQWRTGRTEVAAALRDLPTDKSFPWFGSDMTADLAIPLRLMETWAHGQDIFDTLGVPHVPTTRLRFIAELGVIGRGLSFYAAQLPIPTAPFRIELTAPDGTPWVWGPTDAPQQIHGTAHDFCLLVTHRKPLTAATLTAVGTDAQTWLENARVYL